MPDIDTLLEKVFTVTEVSQAVQGTLEQQFPVVAVQGEVSGLKVAASGHVYFNLKDAQSVLKAIMWRGTAQRMAHMPSEGAHVMAMGRITSYPARSEYQIIVEKMDPLGRGALLQQLEELKQKLAAEGLFDEHRKKPLPFLPKRVGIITSPTGAVIQDMLHRLSDRCPRDVLLWPVAVQGGGAPKQIIAAIEGMNALPVTERPDVLIVARGGGSFEDLLPFSDEAVVRAAAGSVIPLISGVGHEPDFTLIDFVADYRAPTPSAAAERVVPVRDDLCANLAYITRKFALLMQQRLTTEQTRVQHIAQRLPDPKRGITQARLRLEDRAERLEFIVQHQLKQAQQRLMHAQRLLAANAPEAPLKRGYVYLTDSEGNVVQTAKTPVKEVSVTFSDGQRRAVLQP